MTSRKPKPIATEVRRGEYHVVLTVQWRAAGSEFRRVQAATYRICAKGCEASVGERWGVDADVGCGVMGRGLVATTVTIELFEGGEAEAGRAEALLRQIAANLKVG